MELLENLNIKNLFETKKDAIEKFNDVLDQDEIHSQIRDTLDKIESQMHNNIMALEEIEQKKKKLEEYEKELNKRTDSYRDMYTKLEEII